MAKNKKSVPLNMAFGAVLAVVLVATLVIIAIYLFNVLGTTFPTVTATQLNEAGSITTSGYALANVSDCAIDQAIVTARNTTGGEVIAAGNYTIQTGGIVNKTAAGRTYDTVTFNYSFQYKGSACGASQSMLSNFSNYPALVGLVGTIVLLAIVIVVLVTSFSFGGRNV